MPIVSHNPELQSLPLLVSRCLVSCLGLQPRVDTMDTIAEVFETPAMDRGEIGVTTYEGKAKAVDVGTRTSRGRRK